LAIHFRSHVRATALSEGLLGEPAAGRGRRLTPSR
jgi:hypothetical protein